ncbi:MAG: 2,3-bisphosphoglycerate-independent phosphoglycerate mutase, partial [Caldicoprobacterales bacterium]
VGRVVEAIRKVGGSVILTADHGNAEKMVDHESGGPHTAHTNNPVPLIFIDDNRRDVTIREGGRLADIAPTLLELMGLPKPPDMTGESLLK